MIRGGEPQPFVYKSKGTLAALGHFKGVGRVYNVKIYGFVAWWVWRTYYLMQMPQWSRRLRIVIDWTIALFFKNDVVELDLAPRLAPASGGHRLAGETGRRTENNGASAAEASVAPENPSRGRSTRLTESLPE